MSELIRKLKEKKYITKIKVKDDISDELISKEIPQVGSVKIVAAVKEEMGPIKQPYAVMRETNAPLMDIMYKAKLAANEDYMTYEEAANVSDDELNPGGGYGDYYSGIFYKYKDSSNPLTSFDEFQYFTGVGKIKDYTFYNCSSLTSITIPNSVTSIGGDVFRGCSNLGSIVVESDNSVYDSRDNCNAIIKTDTNTLIMGCKNTIIPNSVTSIGGSAFSDCSGLTSITIPNSVTSIGNAAFYGCSSLTSITIPNSVISPIGNYTFNNCSSLTDIVIPDSVTSIGSYAFQDCSNLTSVAIGNSVASIGSYAFQDCSNLTSVAIGNSVTSIGSYAFYGCSSLTSITIPDGVTSISDSAFDDCSSLTSVTIPDSVTSIGGSAFSSCSSLTSITIPDSVTSIGSAAFQSCRGLTSVTIGNSVTSIGSYVFDYCEKLTLITCLATTAPSVSSSTFGSRGYAYTGRNTYDQGINKLKVPSGATGYNTSYWADPLQNSSCCGFTLENI